MRPEELLEQVRDQETFIAFVRALADECEETLQSEAAPPEQDPAGAAPHGPKDAIPWQNGDIPAFLYAALDYFEEGPLHQPETQPGWRMFAEFLWCGKIIE